MAELRKFGKLGPRLTFKCNEGNLTIETIDIVGGEIPGPIFTNPIRDKMWVKLSDDMEIEPCTKTDSDVLGQVIGKPQWKGQMPTADAVWGAYEPRIVTVELMGSRVDMLQLEANNAEILAGDSVIPGATTDQTWDLSIEQAAKVANQTLVLSGAAAASGAKIPVLFNYYGAF